MDDPNLELDLGVEKPEPTLPEDSLAVALPPSEEDGGPLGAALLIANSFPQRDAPSDDFAPVEIGFFPQSQGDTGDRPEDQPWDLGLQAPLFPAVDADASGEAGPPASLFAVPEDLFGDVRSDAQPEQGTIRTDGISVVPWPAVPDAETPEAGVGPAPVTHERVAATPIGAAATPDPDAASVTPDQIPTSLEVATTGGTTDTEVKQVGAQAPSPSARGPSSTPPATPTAAHRRLSGVARRRQVRLAAAGVAAAGVLGALTAVVPDRDRPRQVETVLPGPSVTTVPPPVFSPLSPLVPVGGDQPAPNPPDTPAPQGGTGSHASPGAPSQPGRALVGTPAAASGSPSRVASPASAAPRSAAPSAGSGPSPAPSAPPAAPPPTSAQPADVERDPSEPARGDRRSDTTVATAPPATEPPPPLTTAAPSTEPEPTFPTTPPPTPAPTAPPTTPPTTAPPPLPPDTGPSVPVPTRPCLDGSPPRRVPC